MKNSLRKEKIVGTLFTAFVMCCGTLISGTLFAADHPVPTACDIQSGPCSVVMSDGTKLAFDIQPKPVKAMRELTFTVQLERQGKAVTDASVTIDLSMPGMYMGKNSPALKHTANSRYEGKGLITRCMSGRKTWQADIAVAREQQLRSASFVFEVR